MLLPDAVRARLAGHVDELRARAPWLAWVRAENLHLTLRFLGEVDAGTLEHATAAMRQAAAVTAPFTIVLAGVGTFPPGRPPRIVWAGLAEGGEALGALRRRLEEALVARGIPPEGRAFWGHVTLARARDPRGARGLEGALGKPVTFGGVRVETLHLMRSELGSGGARYSVLAEARLGRGEYSSPVDIETEST